MSERLYTQEAITVMSLIRDDIKSGIVPTGLTHFSELHNYVDANEYLIEALGDNLEFSDEGMAALNNITLEIDEWLQADGPSKPLPTED